MEWIPLGWTFTLTMVRIESLPIARAAVSTAALSLLCSSALACSACGRNARPRTVASIHVLDAGRARAPTDASTAPADSGVHGDVPAGPRGERAADPIAACASVLGNVGTSARVEWLPDDVMPADQRTFPADDPPVPLRTRIARVTSATNETLVLVGPLVSGLEDEPCSRVEVFPWRDREHHRISAGPIATIGRAPLDASAYFVRTDGPYAGGALAIVADSSGRPLHARWYDGAVHAESIAVFAAGDSIRVDAITDSMEFGAPRAAELLGLGADGLYPMAGVLLGFTSLGPCSSFGIGEPSEEGEPAEPRCTRLPAGGFTSVSRVGDPRILAIDAREEMCGSEDDSPCAYRVTPMRFDGTRFVAAGRPRVVRRRHHVVQLPAE
jgi:hypothetical protein